MRSDQEIIDQTNALARTLARALDLDLDFPRNLDEALTMLADICLEVLIEMESPGCKWLAMWADA